MWWSNSSRGFVLCSIMAISAVSISGCGESSDAEQPRQSVREVNSIPTPNSFARLESPKNSSAKEVAATPLPPGWEFQPKKCAPVSVEVSQGDLDAVETVLFRSTTTFVTLVAYDAGTDRGFELPAECKATAIAGPGGAGGFSVPTPVSEISGANAVRGTHSILRDSLDSPTYDQYVFQAQVRGSLRVIVVVAPLLNGEPRVRHVDPEVGITVLRDAVQKLVTS